MGCPFPGMNPYLEMPPFWSDFAPTLLTAVRNEILARLFPRYDVRLEEYLMLTEEDEKLHGIRPDATIVKTSNWSPAAQTALAVAEPTGAELEYPDFDAQVQRDLKIIHLPSERLVTVMELLSPANKAPGTAGLEAYLQKRLELLSTGCHLVEIDLLRGGQRLPMSKTLPRGDYYAFIGRAGNRPRCQVIAWPLRSPIPIIPIPLLAPDPDLLLDLQSVFKKAYDSAIYDSRLHYDAPLEPLLAATDDAWVRQAIYERRQKSSR